MIFCNWILYTVGIQKPDIQIMKPFNYQTNWCPVFEWSDFSNSGSICPNGSLPFDYWSRIWMVDGKEFKFWTGYQITKINLDTILENGSRLFRGVISSGFQMVKYSIAQDQVIRDHSNTGLVCYWDLQCFYNPSKEVIQSYTSQVSWFTLIFHQNNLTVINKPCFITSAWHNLEMVLTSLVSF
jgi:hypothetical protein